jgi:hypothetical protein
MVPSRWRGYRLKPAYRIFPPEEDQKSMTDLLNDDIVGA